MVMCYIFKNHFQTNYNLIIRYLALYKIKYLYLVNSKRLIRINIIFIELSI